MKTLCTAFTADISPLKGKSRLLLPVVCGIGKDVMEQNRMAANCFSITSAFSMLNHAHYLDIKSGKFQSVAELHDRHYLRTVTEVLLLTYCPTENCPARDWKIVSR